MADHDYNLGKQSAPPPAESPITLTWFPSVAIRPFYDEYRVPAELPAAHVREHLRGAAIRCCAALSDFRASAELDGYTSLAACPSPWPLVDGQHPYLVLWRRAVYCEAKAEILKETQLISLSSAKAGAPDTNRSAEETEHKYREFAQDALALIARATRTNVALL
jgi:hypothetical protein